MNDTALPPGPPADGPSIAEPRGLLMDPSANFFDQLLTPVNKDDAWKLCQNVAGSDMCPKSYRGKPFDVAIAGSLGRRIGLDLMTSLQGIAVVNGMPKLWGDVMWGVVYSQHDFESCDEVLEEDGKGEWKWTCTLIRRGRKPIVRSFSKTDAQVAGLLGKDIWRSYPKRMGQWKPRTLCARDAWPEVLAGIVTDVDDAMGAKPVVGVITSSRFSPDAKQAEVVR